MTDYVIHGPDEEIIYHFDFTNALSSDTDVISNGQAYISPSPSPGPTLGAVAINAKVASVEVSDIDLNEIYMLTVSIDVDTGEVLTKNLTIHGGYR